MGAGGNVVCTKSTEILASIDRKLTQAKKIDEIKVQARMPSSVRKPINFIIFYFWCNGLGKKNKQKKN